MNRNFNEIYESYMRLSKETLAKILALKELENNSSGDEIDLPKKPDRQNDKQFDTFMQRCKTWADCTNPHFDCVNCPLMYPVWRGAFSKF